MNRWRWTCLAGLLGTVAISIAVAVVSTHASAAPASAAPSPTHIRVVGGDNSPPFLFVGADGKPQGYEADVWRLFQEHTGIQVELLPTKWTSALQDVSSGKADVVDMIYLTPSRKALYDFSEPYSSQAVGIYVDRHIRGIHDIAALQGFPVGVERGDACEEKLRAQGINDLHEYTDYKAIVDDAVHGNLRIFCMDRDAADFYLYRESALARFNMAFVLYTGQLRWAVRKGNAHMLEVVQNGMALITPAEREQLRKRWLEHPVFVWPYLRMIKIVSAVILLVVALMALWVWMLRRSVARRTRALQEERDKLRTLLDASPDGLWVKDLGGTYLDCNDRAAALIGVARDTLIGHTSAEVLKASNARLIQAMEDEVMLSGEQRTHLFSPQSEDGAVRQVEVVKVPVRAADGSVHGVLSVARDITERLRTETQLRLWAHAFRHAAFGVAVYDVRSMRIIDANPVFAGERGYAPDEMAGMPVDRLYPEYALPERRAARLENNVRSHWLIETDNITRDGRRFPVLLDISVIHDADGEAQYGIVYSQDISARKQAEAELRLAEIAFDSQEPMMVFSADGRIQRVNRAFVRESGFEPGDVIGQPVSIFKPSQPDQAPMQALLEVVRDKGHWRGERWTTDKHGRPRILRTTLSAVRDGKGQVTHFVYAAVDLTDQHAAHANVDRLTYFDPLTDLPNRKHLDGRLQQAVDGAGACEGALLLLDLDHFKRINDLRGHAAGDRLLVLVTQRLRGVVDERCFLSRFGGGTFALLATCGAGDRPVWMEQAQRIAEHLCEVLREPFDLGGEIPAAITASIGWTALIPGQSPPESVLKEAELAMYAAKADGRDRVRRFELGMQAELVRHEELIHELRGAIDGEALDLHLQAQVDREGTVVGAEALVRWTRRCGESVSPALFIPLAENNGLIVQLGDWVLRRACRELVAWATRPRARGLSLAVNVSARQFALPDYVDRVRAILAETGANPAQLKLEITESAVLNDLADAAVKLRELRTLGIRASLDDFGIGYSSLTYLARLPLDQLKIDQSFVARLPDDSSDAIVAHSIVRLGRGLGLEVIAEGVETGAQWQFLMEQGCDAFQGYLFGRPMPCAEFNAKLEERVATA